MPIAFPDLVAGRSDKPLYKSGNNQWFITDSKNS
jgi:hypothetical protein